MSVGTAMIQATIFKEALKITIKTGVPQQRKIKYIDKPAFLGYIFLVNHDVNLTKNPCYYLTQHNNQVE
jgi:hypothetical protein